MPRMAVDLNLGWENALDRIRTAGKVLPSYWPAFCCLATLVCLFAACALNQASHIQYVSDVGRFEYRFPVDGMSGIIIGAPHGALEPISADYARWISRRTGAGLIVAYGFGAKRISVSQPIVGFYPVSTAATRSRLAGSVFPAFKDLLARTAGGDLRMYLGIRFASDETDSRQIDAVTSGFTFEEIKFLTESYARIRDQVIADRTIAKVDLAVEPFDRVPGYLSGIKHHGVLMMAKRGLSLRLPMVLGEATASEAYREVLSLWVTRALPAVMKNLSGRPHMTVKVLGQGRIETIPSRRYLRGVVIGAPHGTFDEYTAEVVKQISFRTGIAAVIAKGFTPTEANGWRINVNRPTEKHYPGGEFELASSRAKAVYESFKEVVHQASEGELELYIDVHQNGRKKNIEVATVGVSGEEAAAIKAMYRKLRDRILKTSHGPARVDLLIEPVDAIEIGAWPTKAEGILGAAKKSLHFELPLYGTLDSARARDAYPRVLGDLIKQIPVLLLPKAQMASGR